MAVKPTDGPAYMAAQARRGKAPRTPIKPVAPRKSVRDQPQPVQKAGKKAVTAVGGQRGKAPRPGQATRAPSQSPRAAGTARAKAPIARTATPTVMPAWRAATINPPARSGVPAQPLPEVISPRNTSNGVSSAKTATYLKRFSQGSNQLKRPQ